MAAETNLLVMVAAAAVVSGLLAGAAAVPAAVAVPGSDGSVVGAGVGASASDQMVGTTNVSSGNASSPSTAARKVRLKDYVSEGVSGGGSGGRASVALQSVLTFFTVFVLCCAAILAVFAWRRFSDSALRVPLPYQYSALSQFEADADDDVNDLDDDLHIMADDSSSDGEANADEDDDDVFVTKITDGAPAMLRVSECRESVVSLSSASAARKTSSGTHSSSSLMDEAPDESLVQ